MRKNIGIFLIGITTSGMILGITKIAIFANKFELFGYPVRNNVHGWLGPTPRDSKCLEDIGKVYDWSCDNIEIFKNNQIDCKIWLKLNGLAIGK